jgi:hypothetical protein
MITVRIFVWVTREGGLPLAGHTQHSQANPTAGGPRQSLTSEIRLTPLSQEVPSARTKTAWELNPHTSLVRYSDCQRSATMHTRPVVTGRPNKGV